MLDTLAQATSAAKIALIIVLQKQNAKQLERNGVHINMEVAATALKAAQHAAQQKNTTALTKQAAQQQEENGALEHHQQQKSLH